MPFAAVKAVPISDGLLLLVTKEGLVSIYDIKANKVRSTGLQVNCLAASSSEMKFYTVEDLNKFSEY